MGSLLCQVSHGLFWAREEAGSFLENKTMQVARYPVDLTVKLAHLGAEEHYPRLLHERVACKG